MATSPLLDPHLFPPRRAPRRRRPLAEELLFHVPLLLLGAAIALFSALIFTERLVTPDEPRPPRPDSRLVDPYSPLPRASVALAPVGGPRPFAPFRDFFQRDTSADTFAPDMDPVERLLRHAALLGDRKTAWFTVDEPLRLLQLAFATGRVPRGPLMPRPEHIPLLAERLHGPALIAFDNRLGAWTVAIPMRKPYETLQALAVDTEVTLADILNEDDDQVRRILELRIDPGTAAARDLPFAGTLYILLHDGLDALFLTNSMFEGRRFLSGLARGYHTYPLTELPNRDVLQWAVDFTPEWRTDPGVESRFVLLAPAATANTTANSDALRMGEWLLGINEWDTLRGHATLSPNGNLQWRLQANTLNGDPRQATMVSLLGSGDARPLLAHLPPGANQAIAIELASLTDSYDAWRDHLVAMGFPGGAEGAAQAERDLAMTLGFWIRDSLLPLLGNRIAVASYGTGPDQTWVAVAEARDPRSVERMIAQASQRLDNKNAQEPATSLASTSARPRAWRVGGNHVIVACGPKAEALLAQPLTASLATTIGAAPGDIASTPLALYSADLLRSFGLTISGAFSVEGESLVLQGTITPPAPVATREGI
jgi:hypothetical protein